MDGVIVLQHCMPRHEKDVVIEILDYGTQTLGPDPFGGVVDGFIQLRGGLWKLVESHARSLTFAYDDELQRSSILFLPVRTETFKGIQSVSRSVRGLLITPTGAQIGEYSRVGYTHLSFEDNEQDPGESLDTSYSCMERTLTYLAQKGCLPELLDDQVQTVPATESTESRV
jgi:hypothetical protein